MRHWPEQPGDGGCTGINPWRRRGISVGRDVSILPVAPVAVKSAGRSIAGAESPQRGKRSTTHNSESSTKWDAALMATHGLCGLAHPGWSHSNGCAALATILRIAARVCILLAMQLVSEATSPYNFFEEKKICLNHSKKKMLLS